MAMIPNENNKIAVSNNSDLEGNIWYTKNIDLSEDGYIKLSPRTVSIISSEENAGVGIPTSFGRGTTGAANLGFYVSTSGSTFNIDLTPGNYFIANDVAANTPAGSINYFGKWWQNRWYQSYGLGIAYRTPPGSTPWTQVALALDGTVAHPIELFRNKNFLAVGDGNTVKLYDNTHTLQNTLTLPPDYEVIGISFQNNQIGIITKLSAAALNQNQEAYFFIWDGAGVVANAGYPIGSDLIAVVIPYLSTWAILTRSGRVMKYNGGGFEEIFELPFYYKDLLWGSSAAREMVGDSMMAEGDRIFLNIGGKVNIFGSKSQNHIQNFNGGIICYDPKVGYYNRFSPSNSKVVLATVTSANVDVTNNIFTTSSVTIPMTGSPVRYSYDPATVIGGLTIGAVYYVIRLDATRFKLATSKDNAIAGIAIDITTIGADDNYFQFLTLLDYGASLFGRSGGIAQTGLKTFVHDKYIFGAEIYDYDSVGFNNTINITATGFENRGYIVTPKITSQEVTDLAQKIFTKYLPLKLNDKIIVKIKSEDILGIPVTTPQNGAYCTWLSSTIFSTTADLSEIKAYLDADSSRQCEVEIVSGAGAGSMAQISLLTYSSGSYTCTLAEEIDGASSLRYCDVIINNWKVLASTDGVLTIGFNNTEGFVEMPIDIVGKYHALKIELRGTNVTIEKLLPITTPQINAV